MKMKRFMAMAIACVMAAGLVACGGSESTATTSTTDSTAATSTTASTAEETTADLSGAVATGGSTSVEKVIGALGEAFMEANPSVDVTYDPTGSGAGVTGAADGTLDIGDRKSVV